MTNDNINIKLTADTGQAVQSTENYKKTLKDLKDQMVQLQVETNGLTEATAEQRQQYAELEQQAGQIADALGDVSSRVKANADDFQSMSAALEGVGAATSIVQTLAGQMALLNGESKSTERLVKTFMALQGQLNAINNIQKVFNKDSKLMISLQSRISTAIKEGGESAKAATIAQKGLNAAMKAAPYIAIASALVTLVSAIVDFVRETDEAKVSQDELGVSVRQTNEELRAQQLLMKADADDMTTTMDTLIKMAKGAGGNVAKLNAIFSSFTDRTGFAVKSVQEMEWAFRLQNNVINKNTKIMEEAANANSTMREQLAELGKQEARLQSDLAQLTEGTGSYDLTLKELQETQNRQKELQNAIISNTKASVKAEQENKNTIAEFNAESAKRNKTEEKAITNSKERKKLTEEEIAILKVLDRIEGTNYANTIKYEDQINSELQEKMLTTANLIEKGKVYVDEMKKVRAEQKELRNQDLDEIGKINAKYDEWIQNVKTLGLTEAQVAILEKEINKNRAIELEKANDKLAKEEAEKEKEDLRKAEDAQNRIDDAVLATRLANLQEGSEEYWGVQQEIMEEHLEQELLALKRQLDDEQITKDEYAAIEKQKKAEHEAALRDLKQQRINEELQMEEQYVQSSEQIFAGLHNVLGALEEAELADERKSEKEKLEIQKKHAIAGLLVNLAESGVALATSIPKTLEAYAEIPFAGPILAAVQIAATTASVMAQIAKINQYQQKINSVKAARGAYVVGPSHEDGGVQYELEGGEVVLNKKAMSIPAYRSIASAMNVSTGGVAFPGTSGGGLLSATIDDRVVDSIVSRTVAAVTVIPVVVSEESITDAQRKVGVLEGRSRLG